MSDIEFSAEEVQMRSLIQRIATGPELSKDLARDEARSGMAQILRHGADPVQAAIYLIALRMKRETDDENAGVHLLGIPFLRAFPSVREPGDEGRPFPLLAPDPERPAVALDDLVGDVQAESRPALLGRLERLENQFPLQIQIAAYFKKK